VISVDNCPEEEKAYRDGLKRRAELEVQVEELKTRLQQLNEKLDETHLCRCYWCESTVTEATARRQRKTLEDLRERCAETVENLDDYDKRRNGFEDLVDKDTAAAAIRALKP